MDQQLTESGLKALKKDELVKLCWNFMQKLDLMMNEISALRAEIVDMKNCNITSTVDTQTAVNKNIGDRITNLERSMNLQNQYSRRECVEIVNIPACAPKDLENKVINIFSAAGVKVYPRDFHAVHRIRDGKTVIAKLVNRKDAISILRNKKKVRNLTNEKKSKLGVEDDTKLYINESLCPGYRYLMGKCSALFKLKHIDGFYTNNGIVKIVTKQVEVDGTEDPVGGVTQNITHLVDLYNLFGKDLIDSLVKAK